MALTKEEYQTYLQSEHWIDFSREIRRDRERCERCRMSKETSWSKYRQNLNVHHKTYERVGCERKEDVELLCQKCHMTEHGMGAWASFLENHSMPEVRKIPLICEQCGRPVGGYVFNFDELMETLCWECR